MEVLSTVRMSSTIETVCQDFLKVTHSHSPLPPQISTTLDRPHCSLLGLLVPVNSSESSTGQPGPYSSLLRQHPLLQVLTTGFRVCHHNWHQRPCIHSSTKIGGRKHGPL